jgi:general secretion pathway protein F
MSQFSYRAIARGGEVVRGTLEAPSRDAVLARLQGEGAVPLQVGAHRPGWLPMRMTTRPPRREIADLLNRLGILLSAGVDLESALAILSSSQRGRLAARLLERLQEGASLAGALRADGRFPALAASMIEAGELSGSLPAAVARLASYLQASEESAAALRSALVYPAILTAAASASVAIVFTGVLPALRPVIETGSGRLPAPVAMAFALSDFLAAYGWMLLVSVAVGVTLGWRALRRPAGRRWRDGWLLRLPWVGTAVMRADVSRFARTLGTLTGGGVALPAALDNAVRVVGNSALNEALGKAAATVREGARLADRLGSIGVLPDMAVQIVRIGEATGQLDRMLLQLADILEQDLRRDTSRALAILVPGLTVVLGMMVAGIVASVMMAVLSINDLAQ